MLTARERSVNPVGISQAALNPGRKSGKLINSPSSNSPMGRSYGVKSFDGTIIRYKVFGKGKRIIIFANGIICIDSYWKYMVKYFSKDYKVITWDYRGHGLSEPPYDINEISIESHARDMMAVLKDIKASQAVLGGFSMGVQVVLEFYRLYPEAVKALLLVGGSYENPIKDFYNPNGSQRISQLSQRVFDAIYCIGSERARGIQEIWRKVWLSRVMYPGGVFIKAISPAASREDMQPYFEHGAGFDVELFLKMSKRMSEHSARDVLEKVDVPALIVCGTHDVWTPYRIMEFMHRKIKGSEILRVKLGTHTVLIDQPELINLRTERFLSSISW